MRCIPEPISQCIDETVHNVTVGGLVVVGVAPVVLLVVCVGALAIVIAFPDTMFWKVAMMG